MKRLTLQDLDKRVRAVCLGAAKGDHRRVRIVSPTEAIVLNAPDPDGYRGADRD